VFNFNKREVMAAVYALLFFCLFKLLFLPVKVSGSSMDPSLKNNDIGVVLKQSYRFGDPKKGDIVCLKYQNKATGESRPLVKRIIGIPGDDVLIMNGDVYINSILIDEGYIGRQQTEGYIELIVPKGGYFVMGDNRTNSLDSRSAEVGIINRKQIMGKLVLRIFPNTQFFE